MHTFIYWCMHYALFQVCRVVREKLTVVKLCQNCSTPRVPFLSSMYKSSGMRTSA